MEQAYRHFKPLVDRPLQGRARHRARELTALFVGRTPLQANKLIEGEIGKWLKVSGTFNNAYKSNSQGDSAVFIQDGSAAIQCAFGPQWTEQINKLNRGDSVSVEGQVWDLQPGNPLYLTKCEVDCPTICGLREYNQIADSLRSNFAKLPELLQAKT
jgi:hypothetical protein